MPEGIRVQRSEPRVDARIVLVECEPSTLEILGEALTSAGYPGPQGVGLRCARDFLRESDPDLVVVELPCPKDESEVLLAGLAERSSQDVPPALIALGNQQDKAGRRWAIEAGAKGFLVKPVNVDDFLFQVHSLLDTRFAHLRLKEARSLLEELVQLRTIELKRAQLETLELLGRVAEVRDDATGQHTRRVGRLSGLIASELHLSPDEVEVIMRAAPLHDLGKVAITDSILLKEEGFDTHERELMREHVAVGAALLEGARSELLIAARVIAAAHHERWDGQGYPSRLAGEEIPLAARIVSVADTFDALTHSRPYKPAWPLADALAEIARERGWQFDPQVVDALFRIAQRGELSAADLPRGLPRSRSGGLGRPGESVRCLSPGSRTS